MIDDIVDRSDGSAFEPEAIAVQPDDADDDGWVTDEEGDEKDEDERDEDERDGGEDGEEKDDDVDDKVAKVPFTGDEVWGSLGEWARSLCRDDLRKTDLVFFQFYQRLRPCSSATTASNVAGSFLSCSGRTIRRWRQQYSTNRGDFDEYGRGKYQRDSLMHDDDFCCRARNWAPHDSKRLPAVRPRLSSARNDSGER